jgi:hypothetical protein
VIKGGGDLLKHSGDNLAPEITFADGSSCALARPVTLPRKRPRPGHLLLCQYMITYGSHKAPPHNIGHVCLAKERIGGKDITNYPVTRVYCYFLECIEEKNTGEKYIFPFVSILLLMLVVKQIVWQTTVNGRAVAPYTLKGERRITPSAASTDISHPVCLPFNESLYTSKVDRQGSTVRFTSQSSL